MDVTPEDLNIIDRIVLYKLNSMGPKTRFELMSMGIKPFMVDHLTKLGILLKEYNPSTNLNYYKVNNGIFEGTKR